MSHKGSPLLLFFFILLAALLIGSGWVDLDWMIVSYRFSEWHRQQPNWEFNPYLRMNWWLAYQFSLWRFAAGWLLLGLTIAWLWRVK
mgnify:CR=1 FL=1